MTQTEFTDYYLCRTLKVVLIGDGGIGKTTLRSVWLGKDFNTREGLNVDYLPTVRADYLVNHIKFHYTPNNASYYVPIQLWDLAGQPHWTTVKRLYFMGAIGALGLFDITNVESFKNLEEWITTFWELNGFGRLPVILVGTKGDQREPSNLPSYVSTENAQKFAINLSARILPKFRFKVHYIETSARENQNIDKAFQLLVHEIFAYRESFGPLEKIKRTKYNFNIARDPNYIPRD